MKIQNYVQWLPKHGIPKLSLQGRYQNQRSTREALERDHEAWITSIVDEIQPLFYKGVMCQGEGDKGYTKAELLEEGIDINKRPAVYVGLCHTHKHSGEGEINRYKTRCAVKGLKCNMQKGTHFTETFAATPREDIGRIMSAL